jgi:sec-independent protein translocase protein TatB
MSGIAPSEFFLICLIGLLILGPERLPRVARKIGGWLGKARQMTRSLQRQLEEETSVKKNFGFDLDEHNPNELMKPRDDDTFSPLHSDEDDEDDVDVDADVDEDKDEDVKIDAPDEGVAK